MTLQYEFQHVGYDNLKNYLWGEFVILNEQGSPVARVNINDFVQPTDTNRVEARIEAERLTAALVDGFNRQQEFGW
jgi:hypothetical protein